MTSRAAAILDALAEAEDKGLDSAIPSKVSAHGLTAVSNPKMRKLAVLKGGKEIGKIFWMRRGDKSVALEAAVKGNIVHKVTDAITRAEHAIKECMKAIGQSAGSSRATEALDRRSMLDHGPSLLESLGRLGAQGITEGR